MVDYLNDNDSCSPYNSAHAAIINCYCLILRDAFARENFDADLWLHKFKVFIQISGTLSLLQQYAELYKITGKWNWEMMDDDGNEINGIPQFSDGEKYVAYITSDDWGFYEDSCPYTFPAVFYSKKEMEMWLLWALKKKMDFQPRLKPFFRQVIDSLFDENELIVLFKKKLSGEISWEYGPARVHEPNMGLWHQKTHDEVMNNWIAQWLD